MSSGNLDFVKYVEIYGGIGHRVGSVAELGVILKTALTEPGVHLTDWPVYCAKNDQTLNLDN
jgi:thiamine pyrophosphate-dependent acetolactate synthase large subunit-like protein